MGGWEKGRFWEAKVKKVYGADKVGFWEEEDAEIGFKAEKGCKAEKNIKITKMSRLKKVERKRIGGSQRKIKKVRKKVECVKGCEYVITFGQTAFKMITTKYRAK